jgi:hypothetical protein
MSKPKIKHTITKKEWNKKHKDFKLMGKDGIPYIMMYDSKIGTHLVPVKIIDESVDEASRGDIHKAAKKGSYPITIVISAKGSKGVGAVRHQQLVDTPMEVPAVLNVLKKKYSTSGHHFSIEDKTGKVLYNEASIQLRQVGRNTGVKLNIKAIKKAIERAGYKVSYQKGSSILNTKGIDVFVPKVRGTLTITQNGELFGDGNWGTEVSSDKEAVVALKKFEKQMSESVNEGIPGMSKQELDRAARGMFGKSYSRLTMDQEAKLKFYLRKSKKESVSESISVEQMKVYSNPYATAFKPMNDESVNESKEEVNPQQLSKIQSDIRKINSKIKVYISKHPMTKGELSIELGAGHDDDSEIQKIYKVLKKHTGDWRTGTMFNESVNEAKRGEFEVGDFVHFKSANKSGLVRGIKGNKVTILTMKGSYTGDIKDVVVLHQDGVNEMDMNDPILVKLRALQMKKNKEAAKKIDTEKQNKNAIKIKALKKKRAEVMRDMEQEAEPEGGKIADRYGKLLNRIDNDIIKLGGNPMSESLNEVDDVYHKSYTHAIEAAEVYAKKKGYEIEDDEMFTKVGMNSKRPSVGKTTRVSLELLKNGKPQRKMLHIQVYGMKNGYELNAYIN